MNAAAEAGTAKFERIGKKNDVSLGNDAFANHWAALDEKNFDLRNHLVRFIQHCGKCIKDKTCINPSMLLELSNILICVLNRIESTENIAGKCSQAVKALRDVPKEEAVFGANGTKKVNERLKLNNFLIEKKNNFFQEMNGINFPLQRKLLNVLRSRIML